MGPFFPLKMRMTRNRWLLVSLAVVALLLVIVFVGRRGPDRVTVDLGAVTRQARFQSTVSASGEIVATRYADIGSSAMGKIVRLAVAEGDRVRAGQLLARIDPVQAESEASGATAQMRALEAEQRAAAEQVRTVTADLEAAEARAREAAQQYQRQRELKDQGIIATAELETARAAAEATAAQVAASRSGIARARQAADAATRRVAQSRAQLARAADVVSKTSIVSPIDGIVSRLRVREGEMVVIGIQNQPGTTLMTISDLSAINAEVKVAEADVLRLAVGQNATVTLEALPGKRFPGRVVEIGASALPVTGSGAAAREFKVVVRLDQPEAGLRPGLTCDAEIVTSERQNVLTVPLQSVVLRGDPAQKAERSGVFVVNDDRVALTPVTAGVIGGLDIEVTGVDEGTAIVVGPYQVLRELNDGAHVRVNSRRETP
jgi:HlyD family secretion protein